MNGDHVYIFYKRPFVTLTFNIVYSNTIGVMFSTIPNWT